MSKCISDLGHYKNRLLFSRITSINCCAASGEQLPTIILVIITIVKIHIFPVSIRMEALVVVTSSKVEVIF